MCLSSLTWLNIGQSSVGLTDVYTSLLLGSFSEMHGLFPGCAEFYVPLIVPVLQCVNIWKHICLFNVDVR